jgi:REP element-mobilizing transposase RayT
MLPASAKRVESMHKRLKDAPYELDYSRRNCVLESIQEVCSHRGWHLLAAHVRTYHVHCVVRAPVSPEKVLNDFKAYASRRLKKEGYDGPKCKRWTRHGSTRYLWEPADAEAIVHYVFYEQGEPMAVFIAG